MSFRVVIEPALGKELAKLAKKDKVLAIAVRKKIDQIARGGDAYVLHFKNLRAGLSDYKRVHVGSFVLSFKVEGNNIIFVSFRHHDDAYE